MRVLVCGGRTWGETHDRDKRVKPQHVWKAERAAVYKALAELEPRPTLIIEGGADGADRIAECWCYSTATPFLCFPADWEQWPRAGGIMRNQRMLDEGRPDLVVALPGGTGTADMVERARRAGVAVVLAGEAPR